VDEIKLKYQLWSLPQLKSLQDQLNFLQTGLFSGESYKIWHCLHWKWHNWHEYKLEMQFNAICYQSTDRH